MPLIRETKIRRLSATGFTIMEVMISLAVTSFLTLSIFALMTMVAKSDAAVDAILAFSNYRGQLAITIASPKNCLALFGGSKIQTVQPGSDTLLELYDVVTGVKTVQRDAMMSHGVLQLCDPRPNLHLQAHQLTRCARRSLLRRLANLANDARKLPETAPQSMQRTPHDKHATGVVPYQCGTVCDVDGGSAG